MESDLSTILLRTIFMYFFLLIIVRVMGKREIGQVSVFDFVVSILMAEIAAVAIEDPDKPLTHGILPIGLLMLAQIITSYLSVKNRKIRELIDGKTSVIINKGKIDDRVMLKNRYNMDDLMQQLREKNIANIADVEFAILEPTGKLSVVKKPEKEGVTREDLGVKYTYRGIPTPLIVDGEVMEENLKNLNKNHLWLKQRLKVFGTTDFSKILFASIDEQGKLHVNFKQRE